MKRRGDATGETDKQVELVEAHLDPRSSIVYAMGNLLLFRHHYRMLSASSQKLLVLEYK